MAIKMRKIVIQYLGIVNKLIIIKIQNKLYVLMMKNKNIFYNLIHYK